MSTASNVTTAYLALGSNIGDRAANMRAACALLSNQPGIEVAARSPLYETQSVEGGGPDDFLNAVVRVDTTLTAQELLAVVRAVETGLGRPQPPRHGSRLIDIDVLLFGDERLDTPELQIPHPRMWRRAFVLRPLSDVLEGGWVKPTSETWD